MLWGSVHQFRNTCEFVDEGGLLQYHMNIAEVPPDDFVLLRLSGFNRIGVQKLGYHPQLLRVISRPRGQLVPGFEKGRDAKNSPIGRRIVGRTSEDSMA
jgi:hypothetical protein